VYYLLNVFREIALKLTEMFAFLVIGFIVTIKILGPIYEGFGVHFSGNVWVNWFGVSYILFVLYTIIVGLFLMKNERLFKQRLTSTFFWLLFIGSNYVVFIPFIKGENPF
jgi:hypothetical protein